MNDDEAKLRDLMELWYVESMLQWQTELLMVLRPDDWVAVMACADISAMANGLDLCNCPALGAPKNE